MRVVLDLLVRLLFGLLCAVLVYFVVGAVVILAIVISWAAYLPSAWVGVVVLAAIGFGIGAAKVEISFPSKNREPQP